MKTTNACPLAVSQNGEPIDLPPTATQWRVRRLPGRVGALEMVYGPEGLPLIVPIDTTPDDFAEAVDHRPGRYRLDAADDERRTVADVPPAYIAVGGGHVREQGHDEDRGVERMARYLSDSLRTLTQQFGESMRVTTEQGAVMMDAAARLVAAADAADITRREAALAQVAPPAAPPTTEAGAAPAQGEAPPPSLAEAIIKGFIGGIGKENVPMLLAGVPMLFKGVIDALRRPAPAPPPPRRPAAPPSRPAQPTSATAQPPPGAPAAATSTPPATEASASSSPEAVSPSGLTVSDRAAAVADLGTLKVVS